MLVPTPNSKDTLKINEELLNNIRDFIRSVTNNSDDYNENYLKINSEDDLRLKKL